MKLDDYPLVGHIPMQTNFYTIENIKRIGRLLLVE